MISACGVLGGKDQCLSFQERVLHTYTLKLGYSKISILLKKKKKKKEYSKEIEYDKHYVLTIPFIITYLSNIYKPKINK